MRKPRSSEEGALSEVPSGKSWRQEARGDETEPGARALTSHRPLPMGPRRDGRWFSWLRAQPRPVQLCLSVSSATGMGEGCSVDPVEEVPTKGAWSDNCFLRCSVTF